VIPLWRPLLVALVAFALGWALDRRGVILPRGSFVRAPLLVLSTLVVAYVGFVAPLLLPPLAGAWLWARRSATSPAQSSTAGDGLTASARTTRRHLDVALAAGAFLVVALLLRPDTPCFWDAFVWLAKARFASRGPLALVQGGLTRGAFAFVPEGYPLFDPFAVAALGGFGSSSRAVVAGATGLELLAMGCFVGALAEERAQSRRESVTRLFVVTALLVTCPLVVVHLRSSYVDLPLGLLLAALALLLPREGTGGACAILAMAMASLKDEGLAHVLVVAALAGVRSFTRAREGARDEARSLRARSAATAVAALAMADAWHLRLAAAHLVNSDHALSHPHLERIGTLIALAVDHLSDFTSWGALWVLALGAAAATTFGRRRAAASAPARRLATLLVADAVVVLAGLLVTPDRVMAFASGGSLLNRIAMQLAPLAALLVAAWLPPGAPATVAR
jgi:hypothetical protein